MTYLFFDMSSDLFFILRRLKLRLVFLGDIEPVSDMGSIPNH